MSYTKILTHAGTHHADEILAISTIFEFVGEIPVERKYNITDEELENPEILILDIGNRLEPKKGNFDHHQNNEIEATNILVLNHFCRDEKLKYLLKKHLYSYVDNVDRGIIIEKDDKDYSTATYNSIIRSLNNIERGFEKSIEISKQILKASIATAEKQIIGEKLWENLEKEGGIAIQHTEEQIVNWHQMAEYSGIMLLISPNPRIEGAYQIISRNSDLLKIPIHKNQIYIHNSGFLAVYRDFKHAFKHANELVKGYFEK